MMSDVEKPQTGNEMFQAKVTLNKLSHSQRFYPNLTLYLSSTRVGK